MTAGDPTSETQAIADALCDWRKFETNLSQGASYYIGPDDRRWWRYPDNEVAASHLEDETIAKAIEMGKFKPVRYDGWKPRNA